MSSDKESDRAGLSKSTGIREDVIEASGLSDGQITELYNKASKGDWWANNVETPGLMITVGSIILDALVNTPAVDQAAGPAFMVGILMWLGGGIAKTRNKLPAAQEIRNAADERLVRLDKKDRMPKP